jgi:hypothetical protein
MKKLFALLLFATICRSQVTGPVVPQGANAPTTITGGACTNQVVTGVSTAGVPTCAPVTSAVVDGSIAPTASPALTGTPTAPTQTAGDASTELATDAFLAAAASSTLPPATVVCDATCGNQTLSGFPTIDGVVVDATSIILLTSQTVTSQNGPWMAASGAWTRPAYYPTGGTVQVTGYSTILIRRGTNYTASLWRQTVNTAITIGTSATAWSNSGLANGGLAVMAADTTKCNNTGSSAAPIDCTVSQLATMLAVPTLSGNNALTGANVFQATAPTLQWDQVGAGTNSGWWGCGVASDVFECSTLTDAQGIGVNWITVMRGAGTAVGAIVLSSGVTVASGGVAVAGTAGTMSMGASGIVKGPAFQTTGTKFTAVGTGCTVGATSGAGTAGTFTLASGPCTSVVVTLNGATGVTATTGWSCPAHDRTAPNVLIGGESSSTTTTASFTIPAGAGTSDVISYSCTAF